MLPTIVPTMMRALVVRLRGVGGIIVCQVDRLELPTLRHLEQSGDVISLTLCEIGAQALDKALAGAKD